MGKQGERRGGSWWWPAVMAEVADDNEGAPGQWGSEVARKRERWMREMRDEMREWRKEKSPVVVMVACLESGDSRELER